jgi:hypothetical protein
MVQGELKIFTDIQPVKIPKPAVRESVNKMPIVGCIVSQMNPVHNFSPYLTELSFR